MSSHLRDAALFYLRRHWSVIPIAPVSKVPPKDFEWAEYQDRLPTEKEVQRWWRRWPHYGVGIVTGKVSNLIVLDVDPDKGADANDVWRRYPTSLVVKTGRGGGHFYYEYPQGQEYIPNVVGKTDGQSNGYDLRADGGYVVAPPSLHPSGRRYEWIETGKKPSPMPPALLQQVLPRAGLNGTATMSEPWLADALRGVGEGARDDTCARLAGYYFSKGMPEDVVREQLLLWNDRNLPPLPESDIDKTLHSIQRTRARHPKTPARVQGTPTADAPDDPLRLISMQQYMVAYGQTDVRWMIPDWLPWATIAMMVSPPGTYKTWTLLDLAISVATGTPFLGTAPVSMTGPVLIFQQEDFHGQMAQRLATIMASRFPMGCTDNGTPGEYVLTLPPSPPIYFHDNRELRFDNPDMMDILEARVAELRPALVIVDPLYSAAPMDDYMAKAITHMMRLKRMRDLYDTTFMLAHHTSKRSKESAREDAWGTQFLNAFLETGWQVRPKREGTALIRRHFKVGKDLPEKALTFDISTEHPSHYKATIHDIDIKFDPDIGIIRALEKAGGSLTKAKLAEVLGIAEGSIWRQAKAMVESGALTLHQGEYSLPTSFDA